MRSRCTTANRGCRAPPEFASGWIMSTSSRSRRPSGEPAGRGTCLILMCPQPQAAEAGLLRRRNRPGGRSMRRLTRPGCDRRHQVGRGTRFEGGPPPRVEIPPRNIRLLERGQPFDNAGPEPGQVRREDPGEPLQAVAKGIEPDVRDGVDSAGGLDELALTLHRLLQRARYRERQLRERGTLPLDAMKVLERQRRAQEGPGAFEIYVAIDRVHVPGLEERGDDRDRIAAHGLPHFPSSTRCVWRAIMSSSLVGTTHALTRLPAALMRGPPRALAAASGSIPSHAASRHTRSRIAGAFSPIPPVNTIVSSPPRAAASEPSSRPMPYT